MMERPENAQRQIHLPIGLIVLAAGGSTRYQGAKVLVDWHGKPMIRHITDISVQSHLGPVIVVTGKLHKEIMDSLDGCGAMLINNPDWEKGLSTSIHVGIKNLPGNCSSAIFLLGDQPFITWELLKKIGNRFKETHESIVAPLVDGKPSNPILFSRKHFNELLSVTGDVGGRELINKYPVDGIPWDDGRLRIDIDTPDDYARWSSS